MSVRTLVVLFHVPVPLSVNLTTTPGARVAVLANVAEVVVALVKSVVVARRVFPAKVVKEEEAERMSPPVKYESWLEVPVLKERSGKKDAAVMDEPRKVEAEAEVMAYTLPL